VARPHVRLPGGGHAIVASKGDAPKHPGWYQNLAKEPQVELQVKGEIPVVVLERG